MKAEYILQADLLDIIFENRNKDYGAYSLRKQYNKRIYKSLGGMMLILSVFSIYFLREEGSVLNVKNYVEDPVYAPAPAPPSIPVKKINAANTVAPKESPKQKITTGAGPIILTDSINITDVPDEPPLNAGKGKNPVTPATPGNGPDTSSIKKVPVSGLIISNGLKDKDRVVTAEVMPSFPGGLKALEKFLQKNLNNPEPLNNEEAVSVKVKFIVGYDGKLRGFEVIQDGGDAFNKEVIRVLKRMPDWIPGKTKGENVSVYFIIPVKFIPSE